MGRILIWKISLLHISDYIFRGIGIGNFSFYYPQWQISYFSNHINSPAFYILNADDSHIAFNEFLQIFTETGIIGLITFTALIIYVLRLKPERNKIFVLALKATIILILFASLSSYALHCNPLLFLFAFCIAALLSFSKTKIFKFSTRRSLPIIIFLLFQTLLFFTAYKSVRQYNLITKWETLRNNLFLAPSEIKSGYLELYPHLKSNGKFLLDMGEHLADINDTKFAVKILEESKKFYFSQRTLLATANAYYQLGDTANTIKNLEELSNLVPYQFYPKYNLVKLYIQSGDFIKATQKARILLSMPVKKPTSDVRLIKEETLRMLNKMAEKNN